MLILTLPLIDQSMHMNLYKVHNLPVIHLTLHIHAQYEIKGSYLATVMDGMFITLPTALDVRLCLMTNGHLCMFNQALYPVECTNWCIYALFINDKKQIEKNCFLQTINHTPWEYWRKISILIVSKTHIGSIDTYWSMYYSYRNSFHMV